MPGVPPRSHPTSPGDGDAIRRYAAKMRRAARTLQSISDDADTQVYFYMGQGQGAWRDKFLSMWDETITGNDQLNSGAWALDRANFVAANPRLARLYDLNTSPSRGAFRSLIDACNKMADSLDQYAHAIDQEYAQEWTIFWDVVIIVASIVVTALSFGALGPEAMMIDIFLVGATIGGFTSAAIDFSNQMVDNVVVNHDTFGGALTHINMQELASAYITGYIVGGVSSVVGMGLPRVLTAAGGFWEAAASNTVARIGIEAVGFGAGTFVGDIAAQEVLSLDTKLRLTPVDFETAGKDAAFATAGGVVLGGLMHGLGVGGRGAPDPAGAADPTSQQWGVAVNTFDETGGKLTYFAVSDPKGGTDLLLFEGIPTGDAVVRPMGPARLVDGATLVANDGKFQLDLTKPGNDVLFQTSRASSLISVGPDGTGRFVAEAAISDGSIKFNVVPGDRSIPAELQVDPNSGEMQVPKDWKVVADYNGGKVTVTAPWSREASYTFSLREPGARGWSGAEPKMIAGPATGGGDPEAGGVHPNVSTEPSPELTVPAGDRPVTVVDGTVVDGTVVHPAAGPPIDPATGSGRLTPDVRPGSPEAQVGPATGSSEATPELVAQTDTGSPEGGRPGGLRLEPAAAPRPPETPGAPDLAPVDRPSPARALPPDQLHGDPGQKLPAPPAGDASPPAPVSPARGLSPGDLAAAERVAAAAKAVGETSGWTKQLGAAGEAADLKALEQRGVVAEDLNVLPSRGGAKNFPLLDNISGEGFRSVKVKMGSSFDPEVPERRLRDYSHDFAKLLDEGWTADAARELLDPRNTAVLQDLQARDAWPQGLPTNASEADVAAFIRAEARLSIPEDHVPKVQEYLRGDIRAHPVNYGFAQGVTPSDAQIQGLVNRVESNGITSAAIDAIVNGASPADAVFWGRGGDKPVGGDQPVANQDQIVQALQQIDGIRPDVWKTLDPGQRVDVLQSVEDTVAGIQGRSPVRVEAAELPVGYLSRYDAATGTIKVSEVALGHGGLLDAQGHVIDGSGDEQTLLGTVLHEGRHAYQDFAITHPGFDPDADQVAAWADNLRTGHYQDPSASDPVQHEKYLSQPVEADARSFEQIAGRVLSGIDQPGEHLPPVGANGGQSPEGTPPIPSGLADAWDGTIEAGGPMLRIPAYPTRPPARGLEGAAGPANTDLGVTTDFGQGPDGTVANHDPELVDLTRTDLVKRSGVQQLDLTQPIPQEFRDQDFMIVNNPHGSRPHGLRVDIANIGQAVRPGGRIIIQGRAEVVPGMRGTNATMNRLLAAVRAGQVPDGFRVVEVLTDPTVPSGRWGDPTVVPKPSWVLGGGDGPFHQTSGGNVGWPNTRIIYERMVDPADTSLPRVAPETSVAQPIALVSPDAGPRRSVVPGPGSPAPAPAAAPAVDSPPSGQPRPQPARALPPDRLGGDPGQPPAEDAAAREPGAAAAAAVADTVGWIRRYGAAGETAELHQAAIAGLARQVAAARAAVWQAVVDQRASTAIGGLLHDLNAGVTALDGSLAAAKDAVGSLRAHGHEVELQLRTLARLGVPREALDPSLRAGAEEAVAGTRVAHLANLVDRFGVELTTAAKLLDDLGFVPATPVDPSVFRATGDLAPAAAVVRDQLSGPAVTASTSLLRRVNEVDQALRTLGPEPASGEAAAALEALRSSIVEAGRALDALDLGRFRLQAEIDLARSLPPEQRPPELGQAEALAANGAWDAMKAALDSGRAVLAAGRMRLEAESPMPLSQPGGGTVQPVQPGNQPVNLITAGSWPAFSRDLADLVRIEADRRGTAPRDELQQFAIQRVLARFFTENPNDWVLKGGQSMLARYPGGRASTDLDFTRITPAEPDSMVQDYERALQRDLGDHLTFVRKDRIPLHGGVVRLHHHVYLGGRELMTIGVDLAPPRTRPVWREAQVVPFPERAIGTGAPGERPNLRVISLDDTLAHKVSGMFTYGRRTIDTKCEECLPMNNGMFMCKEGDLPTRAQDLADVLMIAMSTPWDGPAVHAMLREEFAWRLDQGENLRVPDHFEVPNPAWSKSFAKHAATMPGLPYRSLNEAVSLARAFLNPLLAPEAPRAHWDPHLRLWIPNSEAATGELKVPHPEMAAQPELGGPSPVQRLEATGHAPASDALAGADMIARWDALAAGPGAPGSLDAQLAEVKARPGPTLQAKIRYLHDRIMAPAGYEPTSVTTLDSKNLRVYVHQRGELYIHAAALMADPEATIEIAVQPDRAFQTFRWEAYQAYVAHLDPLPQGMHADQANAVAYWRTLNGRPIHGVDPAELAGDLLELHAQPLRDALKIRQRLIADYGVEPSRIRIAYADAQQEVHYSNTRWLRAHLLALKAVREDPVAARQAMVDAMRGPGEAGRVREARATAVADRLFAANELEAPRKYALLWIRDSREQPVGGRHGPHLDTRPEMVRQMIEALRESHPDRQVVLLGDDLFARRPELRQAWEGDGVLNGVDAETLVEFWAPARNDGRLLSHAEQALFFHHLTTVRDVVQIGMESGALELPAVMGTPTVYLEALEHDGNKGNRWALYRQGWEFGQTESVLDGAGRLLFDDAARPISTFRAGDRFPAPLSTVERVLYGPDLRDPANRRGQATAVYLPAKVSVTADRIVRLVDSGELDHWAARLGRSAEINAEQWQAWTEQDWAKSQYYADQLNRWLRTEVATPESAGQKWDGIRLALNGVIEPRFTVDQTYEGAAIVHAYYELHTDHPLPAGEEARIAAAYAAGPGERGAAVTRVLKDLLGGAELRRQAVDDMRLFRLEPSEIQALRAAIDRVSGIGPSETGGPAPAPAPRGPAGGPGAGTFGPVGARDAAVPGPFGERLDRPVVPGGPAPREVLARFDPARVGLGELTPQEAAGYIAENAAQRPWLALAANSDPLVQRVIAAVDRGQAHFLERHGPYADDARLQLRVTRLEDPAQLDATKRAAGIDAYAARESEHRCPDIATSIRDMEAFAVALAGAAEHPEVLRALQTPFDPARRPARVSLPIEAMLGPDGHRYCAGFRLQPVEGSPEAAVVLRSAWVAARRMGEPAGVEPRALPIETFEGGTVELLFQPNDANDGYEIATMFVDPPIPEVAAGND